MRKNYLFFAGLLLVGVSAYAQPDLNDPRNARVIFHQDFEVAEGLTTEEAYDNWSKTPIDTIHEIEYYSKIGTSSVSSRTDIYDGSPDWEIFAVRTDSTSSEFTDVNPGDGIIMFNGADPTSSKDETAAGVYDKDTWEIVSDNGEDINRSNAFKRYGEDGGKYFFQWTTGGLDKFIGGSSNAGAANWAGKNWTSHYSKDTRSVKKYRRDLYVRGLDIEDSTSYRLTFYIKTKKLNSWSPLFYADVMRGYHHQRAAFSMGYKSGKEFSLTMEDFEDNEWEKVTMMTYYINAHEADGYVMYSGDYSWTDDWTWRPSDEMLAELGKTLNPGEYLNYVKQPDKFFVRLSFATDSIEYSLDNISLTKSWIGGCEYYGDKLRVNFGYDTNLGDLVKEAKAKTNIAAVEVPDEGGKYFEVWCLKKGGDPNNTGDPNDEFDTGDWEEMYIGAAEYHEDGYMYMFTDYYENPVTHELETYKFEDYDQVLVTFHNPTDLPGLTLKYTGSLYPKALDSTWINNGKIVPDFYNEVATPNPYAFEGVHSLNALPPVMQEAPYEEGSFGLTPVPSFSFKFSREIRVDDAGAASVWAKGSVVVNNVEQVWIPTFDEATNTLTITCPDDSWKTMSGDVEIRLIQLYGKGTEAGANVTMHYHFGDFSTEISEAEEYTHSDWRSTLTDPDNNEGCVPVGVWTHCYYNSAEQFEVGKGQQAEGKVRLYIMDYPSNDLDNCGFYLSSRNTKGNSKPKYSGNIFTIVNFAKAGGYSIKFKAIGWDKTTENSGVETHFYLYPKPAGNVENFDFSTFTSNTVVATKTDLGQIDASVYLSSSQVKDVSTGKWPIGTETKEFTFTIETPGDYVFEWCIFDGSSSGLLIGNYTIGKMAESNLSTAYVKKLINALAVAESKLADASENKYKGADYNTLSTAITDGKAYKGHSPSEYDSVVAYINTSVQALKLRMDTVDLFYNTEKDAEDKLAKLKGDSVNLVTYKALDEHLTANTDFDCSIKTTAELTAEIKAYKAEMNALDDRLAIMAKFTDKIAETKAYIDAAARSDYDEYATMVSGYETAVKVSLITTTDDELTNAFDELAAAQRGYVFKYDYYIAKTRQIKELYALAVGLGYEFDSDVKAKVEAIEDEDAELSTLLREAAILQILNIYAENDPTVVGKLEGLDVSALMPNYFMYNNATVNVDIEKNSSGVWRIKRGGVSTALPGWTVTYSSGNIYPGQETIDWAVDGHVFIDGLHFANSTTGTVSAIVEGLPQAYYSVSLDMLQNNLSNSKYNLTTSTDTVELKGTKFTTRKVVEIADSVRLVDGSPLEFSYTITGQSSSGHVGINGAVLKLTNPDDKADYGKLASAQETKMNELLTIVDARQAVKEGVEYYTIGGIKLDAPKAGQILIRKISQNGKVVVDKVMIK